MARHRACNSNPVPDGGLPSLRATSWRLPDIIRSASIRASVSSTGRPVSLKATFDGRGAWRESVLQSSLSGFSPIQADAGQAFIVRPRLEAERGPGSDRHLNLLAEAISLMTFQLESP